MTEPLPMTCPRCNSTDLTLTLQTLTSFSTSGDMSIGDVDTDSFIDLGCNAEECGLLLTQDPGDGRLRRAVVEVTEDAQYEGAMIELAERMIEWARGRADEATRG